MASRIAKDTQKVVCSALPCQLDAPRWMHDDSKGHSQVFVLAPVLTSRGLDDRRSCVRERQCSRSSPLLAIRAAFLALTGMGECLFSG